MTSRKWYGAGIPGQPPTKRVPLAGDKATARRMLDNIVRDAERGSADLPDADAARLPLAAQSVIIGNVQLTDDYIRHIDDLTEDTSISIGTIKGMLERFDIHNKHEFTVYPAMPGCSITCEFAPDKLGEAHAALGKSVNITGYMQYLSDAPFPQKVRVTEIEILPDDADLPTLLDIRNSIPDITDGLTIDQFLDKIRD